MKTLLDFSDNFSRNIRCTWELLEETPAKNKEGRSMKIVEESLEYDQVWHLWKRKRKWKDWVGGASDGNVFLGKPQPGPWEILDPRLSVKGVQHEAKITQLWCLCCAQCLTESSQECPQCKFCLWTQAVAERGGCHFALWQVLEGRSRWCNQACQALHSLSFSTGFLTSPFFKNLNCLFLCSLNIMYS